MSRKIAEEVLPRLRQRYAGRAREGRIRLMDEVCEQRGYSRKHAIKLLGAKAGWGGAWLGLRDQRAALNPFALHREIEGRLRSILHRAGVVTFESMPPPPRHLSGVIYF